MHLINSVYKSRLVTIGPAKDTACKSILQNKRYIWVSFITLKKEFLVFALVFEIHFWKFAKSFWYFRNKFFFYFLFNLFCFLDTTSLFELQFVGYWVIFFSQNQLTFNSIYLVFFLPFTTNFKYFWFFTENHPSQLLIAYGVTILVKLLAYLCWIKLQAILRLDSNIK